MTEETAQVQELELPVLAIRNTVVFPVLAFPINVGRAKSLAAIQAAGADQVVECGPGKVLSGLARRIDKSLQCHSLEAPDALIATAAELN